MDLNRLRGESAGHLPDSPVAQMERQETALLQQQEQQQQLRLAQPSLGASDP